MTKLDLTDEEIEFVTDEIVDRIKDLIFMKLRKRVRKKVELILEQTDLESNTPIEISWTLNLIFGDIEQIVGRLRRL